jgi:elongation factor Ts
MKISASMVKKLRDQTGAGMMECKKALEEVNGDIEKATDILRKKGIADAQKREGKETTEGMIGHYIHMGGKIGVLVEVNCETDFVARNDEFKEFVRDIAMHITASNPIAVDRESVPDNIVEKEKEIYKDQALGMGKPEKIVGKIVEGKLEKYFAQICLLEQPFVKDPDKTVKELLDELRAKVGENIIIRRFVRFKLGEE